MNLIAYSDSEGSSDEAPPVPKPAAKPAAKPAFQKVVDRSNPGKIKLNLPGTTQSQASKDHPDSDAPPAKRARLGAGGGAFSDFNAMLPAPKKPKLDSTAGAPSSSGKKILGKGLGAGVNLRTGAEPAFQREARAETEEYDENGNPVKKQPMNKDDFRAMLNLPPPKTERKPPQEKLPASTSSSEPTNIVSPADPTAEPAPESQAKPIAARPKFLPLSVARGKKKPVRKPITTPPEAISTATTASTSTFQPPQTSEPKPPPKPKVSLFSLSSQDSTPTTAPTNDTTPYQPLLYGTTTNTNEEEEEDQPTPIPDSAFTPFHYQQQQPPSHPPEPSPSANPLTSIAAELNLSASERRQLFGRNPTTTSSSSSSHTTQQPSRLVEFNTDAEYAHNEMLRQQGETVQHNALRSITGTGKNSLKTLVSVAVSQKDALEDHFAAGKRNKREAGNRYGW